MSMPNYLDLDAIPAPRKDFTPTDYDTSQESYAGTGARFGVRSASRFIEGALGGYGDAYNLRKSAEDYVADKVSSLLPEKAQGIGKEVLQAGLKSPTRYIQEKLVDQPYGSTDLFKKASEEITQGYTKPQGDIEKGIDEVFTMAGNLAVGNPQGAGVGVARKLFTDLGLSALNKFAETGVKTFGGGEVAQKATGLGAMIMAGFLGRADPRAVASDLYTLRDSRINPNTTAPVGNLFTDLLQVRQQLTRGGKPTPAQNELISQIDNIMSKAQPGGVIPVEELTAWQTQLNRLRQNYREITFDNREIDPIRQANQRAIGEGLINDPVALTAHREANEAYAAGAQANTMSQWIEKNIPKQFQSGFLGALIGKGVNLSTVVPGAAAVGTGAAGLATARILRHVWQSPTLRREYTRFLGEVAQENIPAAINSASKLNKELEKDTKLKKELKNNDFIDLDLIN